MAVNSSHAMDYPPSIHHKSSYLSALDAAPLLSSFLEATRKTPHLHPDALLLSEGIKYGPKGGSGGGLAIHHLRRIEAGLRGESLTEETKEELRAQFGEEAVPLEAKDYLPGVETDASRGAGDDTRLDDIIEEGERRREKGTKPPAKESEKAKRKREKKERSKREQESKRNLEGAVNEDDGAEDTAGGASAVEDEDGPRKKTKTTHTPALKVNVKKESSPAPALKEKKKSKRDKSKVKKDEGTKGDVQLSDVAAKQEEWQSQRNYELSQKVLEGEVGERDGAPNVRQDGAPPVIVKHDSAGKVEVPSKPITTAEQAERKAAKKARRKEEKAQESKGG